MAIQGIDSLDGVSFDAAQRYVRDVLSINEYSREDSIYGDSKSRPSFSLKSYITYLDNLLTELNSQQDFLGEFSFGNKALNFIFTQAALTAMNPTLGMGQIVSPTIIFGPPPFLGGVTTNTIDVPVSFLDPGTRLAREEDRLKNLYEGNEVEIKVEPGIPPVSIDGPNFSLPNGETLDEARKRLNLYHEERKATENSPFEFVNGTTIGAIQTENAAGVEEFKPDFSTLFVKQNNGPVWNNEPPGGTDFYLPNASIIRENTSFYRAKVKAMAHTDTYFNKQDAEFGYIESDIDSMMSDDDFYVPVSLEDFRKQGRKVYFRAFISDLNETFNTKWSQDDYYGRVDPVVVFKNVERTIKITLKLAAFSQIGLSSMWKKINNFIKMIYPTMNNDRVIVGAPIVRFRVGDVICDSQRRGLPGVIMNPTFNYSQATWETSQFLGFPHELGKVPMMADLSFDFLVLHEESPHVDVNYNFNTHVLRRMGTLSPDDENFGQDNSEPSINLDESIDDFNGF